MRLRRRMGHWVVLAPLLVISAGAGAPVRAAPSDFDRPYWRTNLFKRVITDQKFLLTEWWPQEIRNPAFAGTLGAGLAIAVYSGANGGQGSDFSWERGASGSASPQIKLASTGLTRLGNAAPVAAILGITYLSARRAHDDRLAEASSLATESLADAGIWIVVLKSATARVRPHQSGEGRFFQYGAPQNGSFPSGHAMAAFSVASVFAEKYHDKKWVPWLSYGMATLVSGARVALGRHYPSDVVVGAVLGTSIGRGVVARSSEREARRVPGTFAPTVGPDGRGVGIAWRYSWK